MRRDSCGDLSESLGQTGYGNSANIALDGGYGTLQMAIDSLDADDALALIESVTTVARDCSCTYLIERCPSECEARH